MRDTPSLLEFAATGRLGSIRLRTSQKGIIEQYGEPDWCDCTEWSSPSSVWRLGNAELHFFDHILAHVVCESSQLNYLGREQTVRSDGIEYLMPLENLKQILRENQISWVNDESGDWDGGEMLKTENGVYFYGTPEDAEAEDGTGLKLWMLNDTGQS